MLHNISVAKSFVTIVTVLFISGIICSNTFAQNDYSRSRGYRDNFMITNHFGVFVGLETSQGFMFDKHNYLGAGIGGYVFPTASLPTYMNTFIDYHYYLKEKSSFVLGAKAGWSYAFNYERNGGMKYKNGILVEPNFGWSWMLKSGKGSIWDSGQR